MDVGTISNWGASLYRSTSAVGDGDVGQKGSYYRRQQRKKKPATEDKPAPTLSTSEDSKHTIDIRV